MLSQTTVQAPATAQAQATTQSQAMTQSPRRIVLTQEMIQQHQLSTDPPPPDSLFWTMWNACASIAQQALHTPFIQGIGAGTLDPGVYGSFNVSDAYYCFHGADDYGADAARATDPGLKAFLLAKQAAYERYNATFPTTWRVKSGDSIVPFDVTAKYTDFEAQVCAADDPIYAVVAMLPCEYLWAWLAQQLNPPSAGNLYASWVQGNLGTHGPYAMGNLLNDYQGPIDPAVALQIYTQAMTYEAENFAAPTTAQSTT